MDKYSKKILSHIDSHLGTLVPADWYDWVSSSRLVGEATRLVGETATSVVPPIVQRLSPRIHEVEQYPLMFLFFCRLAEARPDLLPDSGSFDPCNFRSFISWHGGNHHRLDLGRIHGQLQGSAGASAGAGAQDELHQLYALIYKTKGSRADLHRLLYDNVFVPLDVQHHAESVDLTNYVYETARFRLSIYSPAPSTMSRDLDVGRLVHIIDFMGELARVNGRGSGRTPEVPAIVIFAGLQKKYLPDRDNGQARLLCPTHINSGSSLASRGWIFIWRVEELYKVLIHELIHLHGLDFRGSNAEDGVRLLMERYRIVGVDSPNEAYTETWAILLHSIFVSHYLGRKLSDVLRYEMTFTLFQVAKLLGYYQIDRMALLGVHPIHQTTSVFSYFIVKGSLLLSLSEVIKFVGDDIRGLVVERRVGEFFPLVERSMGREDYRILVDRVITDAGTGTGTGTGTGAGTEDFVSRTLRMSCFDLADKGHAQE